MAAFSFSAPSFTDGSTVGQRIRVSGQDLARLAQASLRLREATYDQYRPRPVFLYPVDEEDIDVEAIKFLVGNLGMLDPRIAVGQTTNRTAQRIRVESLSRRCNALWHYGCDPAALGGLWEQLDRPWMPLETRNTPVYCWRRPPLNISEKKTFHYANVAWVLEKDDVFPEAIQSAVWDSTEDAFPTAVAELKDIKAWRYVYLQNVFELMAAHVAALMSSRSTWEIGNKIQRRLQESEKLGIQLGSTVDDDGTKVVRGWEKSRDKIISQFSVYGFIYQVDLILLKNTSAGGTSHANSDASASNGPKHVASFQVKKLVKKMFGDPYADEVRKMLGIIDTQIRNDQASLTYNLIMERNLILQNWRNQLQYAQSQPPFGSFVQANGALAELGS
ncbi:hypothetical protein B0H67DRAFT_558672 [Lasiosphaeris hirsuta]|uniref:Uncharacterized protein n=1 Tax=Lasiosphaeris hirsuta TaxID=260670 RepID=A0AA39ZRQ4_9PEZI|nr:hypothetical protein B0H67DRAFT_558672 [Lasiosphaeris hirsuta]